MRGRQSKAKKFLTCVEIVIQYQSLKAAGRPTSKGRKMRFVTARMAAVRPRLAEGRAATRGGGRHRSQSWLHGRNFL